MLVVVGGGVGVVDVCVVGVGASGVGVVFYVDVGAGVDGCSWW